MAIVLDADQIGHVRSIIAQGKACGFSSNGWVVALMTALQESTMRNLSGGDRDSVGLFQQRPSMEWGTIEQCTTPAYAAQAFYLGVNGQGNPGLQHVAGWESMRPGVAAQTVQRSGFPDAYDKWETDARQLVVDHGSVGAGTIVTSGNINRVPIGPPTGDPGDGDPPPVDPPDDPDEPPTEPPAATASPIRHIRRDGDFLHVRFSDSSYKIFVPTGTNLWIAKKSVIVAPPVDPEDPEDPPVDPPVDPPPSNGQWVHPLRNGVITSGYGPRGGLLHAGVDISTGSADGPGAIGDPIVAICDMRIVIAKPYGGNGLPDAGEYVKGHTVSGNAYSFSHFHGSPGTLKVQVGQTVSAGTELMREGSTGNSTGQHLHLEIWPGHKTGDFFYWGDGTPPDPLPILRAAGVAI